MGARPQQRHPGVSIEGAPVGSLLLQVIRAHAALATEMLAEIGVSAPQELILMKLADHGGSWPQSELVRYLGRDRSTVTNTLQAMERAGLLRRLPSSTDARASVVRLTRRGRKLDPRVREVWIDLERRTTAGLSARDKRELMAQLRGLRTALHAALAGSPARVGRPDREPPASNPT
jgi:MarR family transcriptional regulator, lower aerobic nicotinate degradation pathway regulator